MVHSDLFAQSPESINYATLSILAFFFFEKMNAGSFSLSVTGNQACLTKVMNSHHHHQYLSIHEIVSFLDGLPRYRV